MSLENVEGVRRLYDAFNRLGLAEFLALQAETYITKAEALGAAGLSE